MVWKKIHSSLLHDVEDEFEDDGVVRDVGGGAVDDGDQLGVQVVDARGGEALPAAARVVANLQARETFGNLSIKTRGQNLGRFLMPRKFSNTRRFLS